MSIAAEALMLIASPNRSIDIIHVVLQDNQFNLDNTVVEGTSNWVQSWVKLITAVSADGGEPLCINLSAGMK